MRRRSKQDYWAYVPNPLQPTIQWSLAIVSALSEADRDLSRLNTLAEAHPYEKENEMVTLEGSWDDVQKKLKQPTDRWFFGNIDDIRYNYKSLFFGANQWISLYLMNTS